MTTEKTFEGNLILDYRKGTFRVVKKLSRKLKDSEIPIFVSIKCTIPETPKMKVTGELELSGTTVKKLILDSLDSGSFKQ